MIYSSLEEAFKKKRKQDFKIYILNSITNKEERDMSDARGKGHQDISVWEYTNR